MYWLIFIGIILVVAAVVIYFFSVKKKKKGIPTAKVFSVGNRIRIICLEPDGISKGVYSGVKIGDEGTVNKIDDSGLIFVKLDNGKVCGFFKSELEKI